MRRVTGTKEKGVQLKNALKLAGHANLILFFFFFLQFKIETKYAHSAFSSVIFIIHA